MQPGCESKRVLRIVFACMLQEGIDYRDGQTEGRFVKESMEVVNAQLVPQAG